MARRFGTSRLLLAGGLAALLAACLIAPDGAGAAAKSTARPATRPAAVTGCDGAQPVGGTGTLTCSFDEEFSGNSLDRKVWDVQTTAASGFHTGGECLVDNPANISVGGGTLNLTLTKAAAPFTCTSPSGSYVSQWASGSVYTSAFAQQYGTFEMRAKFTGTNGTPGVQGSLWMYPKQNTYQSLLTVPTEIDVAEAYTDYPDYVMPSVHSASLLVPGGTTNCTVPSYGDAYHVYGLEWTPYALTFKYDGKTCYTVTSLGYLHMGSAAGDPFFILLTQALGSGLNQDTAATPTSNTLHVDYVRVWK